MKYLILILLFGCLPKTYNQTVCEELSMKSYRGFPQAAHEFKKNCRYLYVKYTKELCQMAFRDLIKHGNEERLKFEYGDRILDCFTIRQKKKYLR